MSEPNPPDTFLTQRPPSANTPPGQAAPPTVDLTPPSTNVEHRAAVSATGAVPAAALPVISGYEVLRELGRGGMGVVYLARQIGLNRLVAVKMLLPGAWTSPDEEARFRAEAEAIARLQHPHIVQVFQVGQIGAQHFFTLEFCPGGSLAARLQGQPLPAAIAAALVEKLANAMEAAHEAGIVHRDLKPANILLMDEPAGEGGTRRRTREIGYQPKITDFGLAKHLDRDRGQTRSGAIMGTPSYMAPEQASGQTRLIGPATDVYALGAVLYELLTGRPPFRGDSLMETLDKVRKLDPVPPRKFQRSVPAELEAVVLKCLEKLPGQRYASAQELADDLNRWQSGQGVRARGLTVRRRLSRFVRRRWLSVLSATGFAILALVLLIGADLGWAVPGGATFRRTLDRHEASLLRPAPSLRTLNRAASEIRLAFADKLKERIQPGGYISESLKPGSREADAWTASQVAAAVFRSPESDAATCRAALAGLDRAFAHFVPGYGWTLEFPHGNASSVPTLWVLIAAASAHARAGVIPDEEKDLWRRRLEQIQNALERYRSSDAAGRQLGSWNMYANQQDPADASIYSSGLALLGLLETRKAGLPWRGSEARRDELLGATADWILQQHDGRGWRCNSLQENQFCDGLTIFLSALVQRADVEAAHPLPAAVAVALPDYLAGLATRPWTYPVSVGFFGSAFTDRQGNVVKDTSRQVRFIWYPWSVEATSQWLLRARKQGNAHEQVVEARRVLNHLLNNLGTTATDEALSGYSYVAAETLWCLAGVQLPE